MSERCALTATDFPYQKIEQNTDRSTILEHKEYKHRIVGC
jgi:hypothetical protein